MHGVRTLQYCTISMHKIQVVQNLEPVQHIPFNALVTKGRFHVTHQACQSTPKDVIMSNPNNCINVLYDGYKMNGLLKYAIVTRAPRRAPAPTCIGVWPSNSFSFLLLTGRGWFLQNSSTRTFSTCEKKRDNKPNQSSSTETFLQTYQRTITCLCQKDVCFTGSY